MSGEAGAPGTCGRNYRVPEKAGRHRAPPTPPRTDRFIVPIAAAAAILTAASLIALTAPAVAPDARGAGVHGATVSTAARTARTVHVPLTILPAPVPTIGGPGIWDPEATPSEAAEAPETTRGVPRSPASVPEDAQEPLTATTEPTLTTEPPAPTTEATSPSPTTDAAATPSSATPTEETPVPTEPTATETVPTDIGELIDQALEEVGP